MATLASALAAIGGLGTFVGLVIWLLRAYVARRAASAIAQERQAGADAQQNEAINAELDRTQNAAAAGDAAGGVPNDWLHDPNNRAGK